VSPLGGYGGIHPLWLHLEAVSEPSGSLSEGQELFGGLPAVADAPGADDAGGQLLHAQEVLFLPLVALRQPAEVPAPGTSLSDDVSEASPGTSLSDDVPEA
jgi:hypothetical protein